MRYNGINMKFTHDDQVNYAKLALELLDNEKGDPKNIEIILNFGELIKKYSDEENAVIFDTTEYIYEQLRLINKEDGAFDDINARLQIEESIQARH